jgi:methionine-rich copper-binding protein CopC
MIMRLIFVLSAALFLGVVADEAQAHAFLVKSNPPVGAIVAVKPSTVSLEFSEAIEIGFSGLEFSTAAGGALALNGFRFADNSRKVLVANLPMLAPGAYRVKWRVVSVDTHRTEGEFIFTVKP